MPVVNTNKLFSSIDGAHSGLNDCVGPEVFSEIYQGADLDALFLESIARAEQEALANEIEPIRHYRVDRGIYKISAKHDGDHVVILGGTHGNEPCGVFAQLGLLRDFKSGRLNLLSGSITFAVGNIDAFAHNERPTGPNDMNRAINLEQRESLDPALVDRILAIRRLIGPWKIVLDLHSVSSESPQFAICGRTREGDTLLLPAEHVLTIPFTAQRELQGSVQGWAARFGGSIALTLECGQHQASSTFLNAYNGALDFLRAIGSIPHHNGDLVRFSNKRFFQAFHIEKSAGELSQGESASFEFARRFMGFEHLEEGEHIGTYTISKEGSAEPRFVERVAPKQCVIVMPASGANLAGDKYFLAEEYTPPPSHMKDYMSSKYWP